MDDFDNEYLHNLETVARHAGETAGEHSERCRDLARDAMAAVANGSYGLGWVDDYSFERAHGPEVSTWS